MQDAQAGCWNVKIFCAALFIIFEFYIIILIVQNYFQIYI